MLAFLNCGPEDGRPRQGSLFVPIDPSTAFVSYSREDLEFVFRLAKDLKARGAKVWMDKLDIRPGQRWEASIEAAVDSCSRMLVILSPAAIASKNVLAEASLAIDDGKEVVPVLYRDCKIPFRLRLFQYADLRADYAAGLDEILTTLSAELEGAGYVTAGPVQAEEKRNQAEKEQARIDQEDHQRKAAEEKVRQEELEQKQAAAEQAHLEEERQQAEAEKTRQEQLDRERKFAEEKARQEELGRQRIAVEQARFEEERKRAEADTNPITKLVQDANAAYRLKRYLEAAELYQKAAEQGHAVAQQALGYMYQWGLGVNNDYKKALHWYQLGAALGDASAQTSLGSMYENGMAVDQDYDQALAWYQKGAEQGNPIAIYRLGCMYENGLGVDKNHAAAREWLKKSAR
jgi:TPR repeat protein